jgi:O-antigen ligase
MEENERAIRRIKEHPILGVGFVDLLSKEKRWFFSGGWFGSSVESLHNSVLDILLRLGLVGFIPFLWISALFLLRGFRNWKKINDPFLQAICIGFTVSYVGTFFSGIFDPFFNCWRGVIAIATMWGTNEAIYRVEGIEDKR